MRDVYLDNVKGVLIILVVIGHIAIPFMDNINPAKCMYNFIYLFHMPMFMMISGYLSHSDKTLKENVYTILLPAIIFQTIYIIEELLLNFTNLKMLLLEAIFFPGYGLWYLICVFIWRAIIPFFSKLKHPIFISMAIGLLGGLIAGHKGSFMLYKILSFFPFFVFGYYLKQSSTDIHVVINNKYLKLIGIVVLISALISSFFISDSYMRQLVYEKNILTMNPVYISVLSRISSYFVEITIGISFSIFITKNVSLFTKLGRRSIYIYILSGVIISTITTCNGWSGYQELKYFIPIALTGILISFILSSDVIVRIFNPIIEPGKFFKLTERSLAVHPPIES